MATITKSIGTSARDYSTITLWEAAIGGDAGGAGDAAEGECYDDSAFDENVAFTDSTPDSILLTVAAGEEGFGIDGAGARIVRTSGGFVISLSLTNVTTLISKLEIDMNGNHTGTGGITGGAITNNNTGVMPVGHMLSIHGAGGSTFGGGGRCVGNAFNNAMSLFSCFFRDMQVTGGGSAARSAAYVSNGSSASVTLQNLSIRDITATAGVAGAIRIEAGPSITLENIAATGCDQSYQATATPTVFSNTNADDDNTLPDRIAITSAVFVSSTDLHAAAGSNALVDAGTDVGGLAATDIDGETRTGTWDIGGDERIAVAGVVPTPYYYRHLQGAC